MTREMDVDSLIPLTLRLQALENTIKGDSATSSTSTTVPASGPSGSHGKNCIQRIQGVEEALERIGGQSEGLKRFLSSYEAYKHLLSTGPSVGSDEELQEGDTIDGIKDDVKVSILLESREEIVLAERDLREIEALKGKGVEGSGELESILPFREDIARRLEVSERHTKDVQKVKQEVLTLVKRYTDFSSTVSDMFIELHHELQNMEEIVRKAERAKRKELSERY